MEMGEEKKGEIKNVIIFPVKRGLANEREGVKKEGIICVISSRQ